MRLIDADALGIGKANRDCFDDPKYADGWNNAIEIINNAPTIEAEPVRHGRWIYGAENFTCGNHNAECSVCHCNISWSGCDEDFNYCPKCGAKMDGAADDAYALLDRR